MAPCRIEQGERHVATNKCEAGWGTRIALPGLARFRAALREGTAHDVTALMAYIGRSRKTAPPLMRRAKYGTKNSQPALLV